MGRYSGGKSAVVTERLAASAAIAAEAPGGRLPAADAMPDLARALVVSGLVLDDGGDEDQAIAACLLSAVEAGCGRALLMRVERCFGPRVAEIIVGCCDGVDLAATESWTARQSRHLARLSAATDEAVLRVALATEVHGARSLVQGLRRDGSRFWERCGRGSARDQLWYHGGVLALFQERRPGPLTADLATAVGELSWQVAYDQAWTSPTPPLWHDPDFHTCQAPVGWIQARSAAEAIQLLDEFTVHELSLAAGPDAERVIDWLIANESADRDPWPTERLRFHGRHGYIATDLRAAEPEPGAVVGSR